MRAFISQSDHSNHVYLIGNDADYFYVPRKDFDQMLTLTCKKKQRVMITVPQGSRATIIVEMVGVRSHRSCRLGFIAPKNCEIYREAIYDRICKEQEQIESGTKTQPQQDPAPNDDTTLSLDGMGPV